MVGRFVGHFVGHLCEMAHHAPREPPCGGGRVGRASTFRGPGQAAVSFLVTVAGCGQVQEYVYVQGLAPKGF